MRPTTKARTSTILLTIITQLLLSSKEREENKIRRRILMLLKNKMLVQTRREIAQILTVMRSSRELVVLIQLTRRKAKSVTQSPKVKYQTTKNLEVLSR